VPGTRFREVPVPFFDAAFRSHGGSLECPMQVLWLVRKNLTQHPGGDTTQILQTAAALRALGVQVELCSDSRPRMDGYDVVHLFHLDRLWENEPYCRQIRQQRRPAVLSTIYWPPDEFDRGGRAGFQGRLARRVGSRAYENLRLVQRWGMNVARERSAASLSPRVWSFQRAVRFVLETVRVLLPNSRAEQQEIERRFGVCRPTVVVPNAADVALFGPPDRATEQPRCGVLCVGRIEPRKNQLALIEALRGAEIPLTLVGQAGRYNARYYRGCQKAAGQNVRFVDRQPAAALRELYRAARVHACVSWYETPGLANLEAALCGCAIVATPGGCTREYLGGDAHYCRPDDPAAIRAAVETALTVGPAERLARRVACEFTWAAAAEKTLLGYRLALGRSS
jgi:glycosyltransferase involved in cell wall biosynthesis